MSISPGFGAGWTCVQCGVWVPSETDHVCPRSVTQITTTVPLPMTPTVTFGSLYALAEAERLRLILKTKDEIIAALRRRIEAQDEWARELMRLL